MNINEVLQGLSNLGGEMQRVRSPKKIKKIKPGKKHKNFKEADQVKHSERLPKTVPPNTKHQSKHPYKGRLAEELRYVIYVGEEPKVHFGSEAEAKKWLSMFNVSGKASIRAVEDPNKRKPDADWIGLQKEAEEPKADTSARAKLNHSLVSQGHKVQKDKKKELKKGAVKHKGKPLDEISKNTEYQEEFAILDAIRDTGKVNMAGAGVYLQDLFGHDKRKAREILVLWINDKQRHESINEGKERDIIANASKERLIDMFLDSEDEFENRDALENAVYNALTDLDVKDVVDPDMEVDGQRMGDFASGRVIDVISDSGKLIDNVMGYLNTDVFREAEDPLNFPAKEIRAQYDRVKKDGYKPSTEFLLWLSKEKGFTMGDLEKIGDQRFYKTAQLYAEYIKATGKDPETNFPVKKPVYRQKELPLKMTPHQKEFDF